MSNQKINWSIEKRRLSELTPYDKNPRIIKGKKFDDLKKSISKFGLAEPIIINTDDVIIGGHARFYVLKEQGVEYADCYIPDRKLDDKEFQELNIRLNKNVAGEFDFEALANWFDKDALMEWGFEDFEFHDFGVGTKNSQGKLDKIDEAGGGESKIYTCPNCNHQWKPEKKD